MERTPRGGGGGLGSRGKADSPTFRKGDIYDQTNITSSLCQGGDPAPSYLSKRVCVWGGGAVGAGGGGGLGWVGLGSPDLKNATDTSIEKFGSPGSGAIIGVV